MDRLSFLLTFMTGSVLTGVVVVTLFTLNYYNWTAVAAAVVIGFGLSWPVAYVISRRIKRQDSNWDETRKDRTDAVPRPGSPEV
ncbi:MAG: hypothetical protein AAFV31_14280 [Pseudomonadota bacterium]